jgi:acetyl-CoA C-acetyltransferase
MSKKSYPIIIGAAQYTQPKDTPHPLDPLNLMVKTCQMALDDTGNDDIKQYIDSLYMVNINSWSYKDTPSELSKILDIIPARKVYLPDGGDSPQMLVNRAAKAIASG